MGRWGAADEELPVQTERIKHVSGCIYPGSIHEKLLSLLTKV